ncbi:MAG: hypothetical protein M3083_09815 [Actinomycetota bacterium]|nr:hypothetical protein [Actinomycetota bacterium]
MSDGSEEPQADNSGAGRGETDLESVEVITTEVEADGTTVVDDLVAEVDAQGNIVATDELVEIELPDGTVIVEETFSVADESGDLVVIEEDTTVLSTEEGEDDAALSGLDSQSVENNGSAGPDGGGGT